MWFPPRLHDAVFPERAGMHVGDVLVVEVLREHRVEWVRDDLFVRDAEHVLNRCEPILSERHFGGDFAYTVGARPNCALGGCQ